MVISSMAQMLNLQVLQCAALVLTLSAATGRAGGLSYDYYQRSCPNLEAIVQKTMVPFFISDLRSPAAFLRLLFHDCQVQGCDGSILLDSDPDKGIVSEMESDKNFAIKFRENLGIVKAMVEVVCPGVVSCADLVPLAAREAVTFFGGPRIAVPLGRKDATTASNLIADTSLPSAKVDVDGSLSLFMAKGLSVEESVALLGGHTIGVGHCINIVHRLYNPENTEQANMNAAYQLFLRLTCPAKVPSTNTTYLPNDLTAGLFDNQYFQDITNGRGLFAIDAALPLDPRTAPYVEAFAADKGYFFTVFSTAFVKLSSAGVLTGVDGEIRRQCNRVN